MLGGQRRRAALSARGRSGWRQPRRGFPGGGRRDAPPRARPSPQPPRHRHLPLQVRAPRERGSPRADGRARSCAAAWASLRQPRLAARLQTAGLPAAAPCAAAPCGACEALPPAGPARARRRRDGSRGSGGAAGKPATDPGRVGGRVPDPRGAGREGEQEMPITMRPRRQAGLGGAQGIVKSKLTPREVPASPHWEMQRKETGWTREPAQARFLVFSWPFLPDSRA